MKVAIIMSGHLRSFRNTWRSFHKAFSHLNPDVFCHTWSTMGHSDAVWWSPHGDNNKDAVTDEVKEEIRNYYRPKNLQVDVQQHYPPPEKYAGKNGFTAVKNQFLGIWKANQMRWAYEQETKTVYDCVIRTRYDIEYHNLLLNNEVMDNNHLWIMPTPGSKEAGTLSETVFFSNVLNMNRICDLYLEIEKWAPLALDVHPYFEGEIPFRSYVQHLGLYDKVKYSRLRCYIQRIGGGKLQLF